MKKLIINNLRAKVIIECDDLEIFIHLILDKYGIFTIV